jgi:hypothetical protein
MSYSSESNFPSDHTDSAPRPPRNGIIPLNRFQSYVHLQQADDIHGERVTNVLLKRIQFQDVQNANLQDEKKQLEDENKQLHDKNAGLEQFVKDLEAAITDKNVAITERDEQVQKEKAGWESELNRLNTVNQDLVAAKDVEIAEREQKSEKEKVESNNEINRLKAQLYDQRVEHDAALADNAELQAMNKCLEEQIEARNTIPQHIPGRRSPTASLSSSFTNSSPYESSCSETSRSESSRSESSRSESLRSGSGEKSTRLHHLLAIHSELAGINTRRPRRRSQIEPGNQRLTRVKARLSPMAGGASTIDILKQLHRLTESP